MRTNLVIKDYLVEQHPHKWRRIWSAPDDAYLISSTVRHRKPLYFEQQIAQASAEYLIGQTIVSDNFFQMTGQDWTCTKVPHTPGQSVYVLCVREKVEISAFTFFPVQDRTCFGKIHEFGKNDGNQSNDNDNNNYERGKPKSPTKMPCRDFTPEDITTICSDIARRDNILVQVQTKKSGGGIFQRLNSTDDPKQPTSAIARRLSVANGIPCVDNTDNTGPPFRKFSVDSMLNQRQKKRPLAPPFAADVTGLQGRDVIAMAILVDKNGTPIRTYTETQSIPSEEVEKADNIFLSRVPVYAPPRTLVPENNNIANVKLLADILEDLDIKQSAKLMKRMDKIFIRLHTTDLNTALSFLKVDRYQDVRRDAITELLTFATKELKVII